MLIHCITNHVTIESCADAVLAVGGKPTMSHHPAEAREVTGDADALVCNLGATESYHAMGIALRTASRLGKPIVLDPVGVAGMKHRLRVARAFLRRYHITCIRGNYSEITALLTGRKTAKGIDAADPSQTQAISQSAIALSKRYRCLVVASGPIDYIAAGDEAREVSGGSPLMSSITGTGCMLSCIAGSCLAEAQDPAEYPTALENACRRMKAAGAYAADRVREEESGTGSFRRYLMDGLSLSKNM